MALINGTDFIAVSTHDCECAAKFYGGEADSHPAKLSER